MGWISKQGMSEEIFQPWMASRCGLFFSRRGGRDENALRLSHKIKWKNIVYWVGWAGREGGVRNWAVQNRKAEPQLKWFGTSIVLKAVVSELVIKNTADIGKWTWKALDKPKGNFVCRKYIFPFPELSQDLKLWNAHGEAAQEAVARTAWWLKLCWATTSTFLLPAPNTALPSYLFLQKDCL